MTPLVRGLLGIEASGRRPRARPSRRSSPRTGTACPWERGGRSPAGRPRPRARGRAPTITVTPPGRCRCPPCVLAPAFPLDARSAPSPSTARRRRFRRRPRATSSASKWIVPAGASRSRAAIVFACDEGTDVFTPLALPDAGRTSEGLRILRARAEKRRAAAGPRRARRAVLSRRRAHAAAPRPRARRQRDPGAAGRGPPGLVRGRGRRVTCGARSSCRSVRGSGGVPQEERTFSAGAAGGCVRTNGSPAVTILAIFLPRVRDLARRILAEQRRDRGETPLYPRRTGRLSGVSSVRVVPEESGPRASHDGRAPMPGIVDRAEDPGDDNNRFRRHAAAPLDFSKRPRSHRDHVNRLRGGRRVRHDLGDAAVEGGEHPPAGNGEGKQMRIRHLSVPHRASVARHVSRKRWRRRRTRTHGQAARSSGPATGWLPPGDLASGTILELDDTRTKPLCVWGTSPPLLCPLAGGEPPVGGLMKHMVRPGQGDEDVDVEQEGSNLVVEGPRHGLRRQRREHQVKPERQGIHAVSPRDAGRGRAAPGRKALDRDSASATGRGCAPPAGHRCPDRQWFSLHESRPRIITMSRCDDALDRGGAHHGTAAVPSRSMTTRRPSTSRSTSTVPLGQRTSTRSARARAAEAEVEAQVVVRVVARLAEDGPRLGAPPRRRRPRWRRGRRGSTACPRGAPPASRSRPRSRSEAATAARSCSSRARPRRRRCRRRRRRRPGSSAPGAGPARWWS